MSTVNHESQESKDVCAATSSSSFTADADDAPHEMLVRRLCKRGHQWVSLTTVKGRGIQPGVNLDCSASLLELMEEPEQIP